MLSAERRKRVDDVICKNQPTLNWGIGIVVGHGARNKTIRLAVLGTDKQK